MPAPGPGGPRRSRVKVSSASRRHAGSVLAAISQPAPGRPAPGTHWRCASRTCARSPTLDLTGAGSLSVPSTGGWTSTTRASRSPRRPPGRSELRPGESHPAAETVDQRDSATGLAPEPYGYGAVHDRDEINRALLDPRRYDRLGYHPAITDRGSGARHARPRHRGGRRTCWRAAGLAPEADLVRALAYRQRSGLPLGSSVGCWRALTLSPARQARSRGWRISCWPARRATRRNQSCRTGIR